jgi:hypothetical protein
MKNLKSDNSKNRNTNGQENNQNPNEDWDDDFYEDYAPQRWSKDNSRKVLKFKEYKAK